MRLLHVDTLEPKEFHGSEIPPYAVLSHVWNEEEVTFQDLERYHRELRLQRLGQPQEPDLRPSKPIQERTGFQKIVKFAGWAKDLGYERIWVDTCCVDKTSSAEQTEAINSMFLWYKNAKLCGAYLSDVDGTLEERTDTQEFKSSRWFSRGWTLQALLASANLVFINASWTAIGTKYSVRLDDPLAQANVSHQLLNRLPTACDTVAEITGIHPGCLKALEPIDSFDFATRMSWASKRETSKKEDAAYSMLGLFGIHMPVLYGEGEKALVRLQEEYMKYNEDLSPLVWGVGEHSDPLLARRNDGLLARSPSAFANVDSRTFADNVAGPALDNWLQGVFCTGVPPPSFTSRGLQVTAPIIKTPCKAIYVLLQRKLSLGMQVVMLPLVHEKGDIYLRPLFGVPWCLRQLPDEDVLIQTETIFIRPEPHLIDPGRQNKLVRYSQLTRHGYSLVDSFPPTAIVSPSEQDTIVVDESIPGEILLRFKAPRAESLPPRIIILCVSFEHQTVGLAAPEDDGSSMLDVLVRMSDGRSLEFSNPISVPEAGTLHAGFLAEGNEGRDELIVECGVPET